MLVESTHEAAEPLFKKVKVTPAYQMISSVVEKNSEWQVGARYDAADRGGAG